MNGPITIPISDVARRWAEVARSALANPVVLTNHEKPCACLARLDECHLELYADAPIVRHREAGRKLSSLVARAHSDGIVLVLCRGEQVLAIWPLLDPVL